MIKVNVSLKTFLIVSSSKKNSKLSLDRYIHTAFQTLLLTWHRRKNLQRVDMTIYTLINYLKLTLYFLFTIPHKVSSFQGFCLLLWTANLKSNTLLVRTKSITCMSPCQRLIVPNLIFIGLVLRKDFWENNWSESFYKTREVIN